MVFKKASTSIATDIDTNPWSTCPPYLLVQVYDQFLISSEVTLLWQCVKKSWSCSEILSSQEQKWQIRTQRLTCILQVKPVCMSQQTVPTVARSFVWTCWMCPALVRCTMTPGCLGIPGGDQSSSKSRGTAWLYNFWKFLCWVCFSWLECGGGNTKWRGSNSHLPSAGPGKFSLQQSPFYTGPMGVPQALGMESVMFHSCRLKWTHS